MRIILSDGATADEIAVKKIQADKMTFLLGLQKDVVFAEESHQNAVGASFSYIEPEELKSGLGLNVNYLHLISDNAAIEFSAETYKLDRESGGIIWGEVDVEMIAFDIQFRTKSKIPQFYIGAGIGYYMFSVKESDVMIDLCLTLDGEICTITIDNSLGLHIITGIDYPINNNLTLNFDVRSAFGKADTQFNYPVSNVSIANDFNIDHSRIALGLRYWF